MIKKLGAKALFATHYHELTELEGKLKGVHNYCIAVKENNDDLIFLRKIIPGGADKSYGIAVAKLAGVPDEVIKRANEIAEELSLSDITLDAGRIRALGSDDEHGTETSDNATLQGQTRFKASNSLYLDTDRLCKDIVKRIKETDINRLTPMEALFLLGELQEKLKK